MRQLLGSICVDVGAKGFEQLVRGCGLQLGIVLDRGFERWDVRVAELVGDGQQLLFILLHLIETQLVNLRRASGWSWCSA